MNRRIDITVPREIVNEDVVTVAEWQVANGDRVEPNKTVVIIETSKAVLEVEAEVGGYVEILYARGRQVEVGATIGFINSSPSCENPTKGDQGSSAEPLHLTTEGLEQRSRFSAKAMKVIHDHNIELSVFAGHGLVREVDVLAYLRQREVPQEDGQVGARGEWGDVRASAKERGRGTIWLVFNYIWRTWFLGNMVRWAPRILILYLHRLRGVKIGKSCFIDPSAVVETAHPENIIIGCDVRIAAHAVVMTHIKPPHFLREEDLMPSSIEPVVLEDHCFIGVNAVIMPGVTVGKAAVVASGAVVVGNVPAFTLVAGNPAKVVKRFTESRN